MLGITYENLATGKALVKWQHGRDTLEKIEDLKEDLGPEYYVFVARSKLSRKEQQAFWAAEENASTRSMSRARRADKKIVEVDRRRTGGAAAPLVSKLCTYCPSTTLAWLCTAEECSRVICANCIKYLSHTLPKEEACELLRDGKFRCEAHGGTVEIPLHPLNTLYSGASSSSPTVRVGVYTAAKDAHGWGQQLSKVGMMVQFFMLQWSKPYQHGELDAVILDYHSAKETGHATLHESGLEPVMQAEIQARFITPRTATVFSMTCGGQRLQLPAVKAMSSEVHPGVQFVLLDLERMIVGDELVHRVVHTIKDTHLRGLSSPKDALKVNFSAAHASIYRPALLHAGKIVSIVDPPAPSTFTENNNRSGQQLRLKRLRRDRNDGNDLDDSDASDSERPLNKKHALALPVQEGEGAISLASIASPSVVPVPSVPIRGHAGGQQKKPLERLLQAHSITILREPPPGVPAGFAEKVARDFRLFKPLYAQAQWTTTAVATGSNRVGACTLVFTYRGLVNKQEDGAAWRERTKHLDRYIPVRPLSLHRADVTALFQLLQVEKTNPKAYDLKDLLTVARLQ